MPIYRGVDDGEIEVQKETKVRANVITIHPPQPRNDDDLRMVCKALNALLYDYVDADDPEIGFTAMEWMCRLGQIDERFRKILWDGHRKMFATSIFEKSGFVIR